MVSEASPSLKNMPFRKEWMDRFLELTFDVPSALIDKFFRACGVVREGAVAEIVPKHVSTQKLLSTST